MNMLKNVLCFTVGILMLLPSLGWAEDFDVNAEARVFNPDILYVKPGDTIHWTNMTSHDMGSVDGLIPEGAKPWKGTMGENLSVTLDVEGVYGYACPVHLGFGMMGVIVVGKPVNIGSEMAYAQEKLEGPNRRIIGKLLKVQQAAKQ